MLLLQAALGAAHSAPVGHGAEVHLSDDFGEEFVHHGLALGRRLHEGTAPVLGQRLPLARGHLPLRLQVHFVPDQHHRDLLIPLDSYDLISHGLDVLETLLVDEAVDQDEPLAVPYVEIPHRGELLRARRVQDLQHGRRRVHFDLFPVEVLYRRVVFLYKSPGHELNGERRLAHSAAAQHYDLILSHLSLSPATLPKLAPKMSKEISL